MSNVECGITDPQSPTYGCRTIHNPQSKIHNPQSTILNRGQVLVIFALAFFALLAFVGLVTDAASLYVTYGQLKRAVDAAAVAAANEFKRDATLDNMTQSAREVLALHNVDMVNVDLKVYICDANGDGIRDSSLQAIAPDFYAKCPDTTSPANESPRKLVYVDAKQKAPLYFLFLFGVQGVTLETNAISEAALVNLVLAIDVSGSMGSAPGTPHYDPNNYDPFAPGNCNRSNTCYPLRDAKDAAVSLIDTLYGGYDTVGIVTFSVEANVVGGGMTGDLNAAKNLLQANYTDTTDKNNGGVFLNYDTPSGLMWGNWQALGHSNPINPEDRDGDGQDYDNPAKLGYTCPTFDDANPGWTDPQQIRGRWWTFENGAPDLGWNHSWGGLPCDDDNLLDSINWNNTGQFTMSDDTTSRNLLISHGWDGASVDEVNYLHFLSGNTTCTGCGMRTAANLLKLQGSPSAVWVIIFLSDGVANQTDIPRTNGDVPLTNLNGYCYGSLNSGVDVFWNVLCIDYTPNNPRYCVNIYNTDSTCPPASVGGFDLDNPDPNNHPDYTYSPEDYARDMTDGAALLKSANPYEKKGNDIAIYSIGLGTVGHVNWPGVGTSYGEGLLRYMAAVGDDGDRTTDPCSAIAEKRSCGNYYYAANGAALRPIFDSIASRIYTKITE